MRKGPDKLKSAGGKKVSESGTQKFDKGEKIRADIKARAGRVIKEKTTVTRERTVSEGAEVSIGKKRSQKKKPGQKKSAEKKHSKAGGKDTPADADIVTPAAASLVPSDVEIVEPILTAEEIAALQAVLNPAPEPAPPAPEAEASQKQEFGRDARAVYNPEELAEFEKLGIPLDTAGSYVFVTERNEDGTPKRYRSWSPDSVQFFIDGKISAERVKFYMSKIPQCISGDIKEWEKHPELAIDIIVQCPQRFPANLVEFYAGHFQKHSEITWWHIPRYPKEFSPHDVANLVLAGIEWLDSQRHTGLFSEQSNMTDLFDYEQRGWLQQGKVLPAVKIAYNRYGTNWTDGAILYFAQHRAKPGLVASYPKDFSPEDRVYCIENFVTPGDIARYPEWTKVYKTESSVVKRVCSLIKHGVDSKLARQVFERYGERQDEHSAWSNLEKLVKAKMLLDQALKYLEKYIISAEYVVDFINSKVSPETVHDYISKIGGRVEYAFICVCAAAGMTADSAKPYWEDGVREPADAVALWKGKVDTDAAKPYGRLYYTYGSEKRRGEHNPSGAEIVRYIKEGASPGVAALLRKADFDEGELQDAQRQFNKAETRSKIFKVVGGILAVAAVVGIGYKACHGCGAEKEKNEKPTTQATTQTAETTAEHGDDTPAEKDARESAKRRGVPFMTKKEAYASGKLVANVDGEWNTMAGYKFINDEELNWAIVPREGQASSPEDLRVECQYNFTPAPDGKGKVKADCTQLDNEKLIVKGVRGSLPDLKIADAVVTGIFNGHSYTCEETDFFMPEDRTRAQALDPLNRNIACKILDK